MYYHNLHSAQDLCLTALQRDRESPERGFDGVDGFDGIDGIGREAGADL
jgi:hypothetical protein